MLVLKKINVRIGDEFKFNIQKTRSVSHHANLIYLF
jgi:hypothetical protein